MTNYFRALQYLYTLNRRSSWSIEKLSTYQTKKLRWMMHYAYAHVPFYHKQFNMLGIKSSDLESAEDLNKLPILRKDDIRGNLDSMISSEYDSQHLIARSTSGSTGKPLFFYLSQSELEFRKAKHLRANISLGQRPFDHWVTLTAPHHFAESTKLQSIVGLYSPKPISVFEDVSRQIALAEGMRLDVLDGYSSALLLFAKEVERTGNRRIRPRFIIGGAELIDDSSRSFIEETMCAPLYDQYSSVEMERMAWQCSNRQGYHIDSDALVMQFVDENGEEVSSGESGEIVCTSLFNCAMPFIRYAIGDIGRPSDEYCDCGRPFPLMKVIEGRKDSLLLLPDGRVIAPRTFTIAMNSFKFYRFIDQFRIIQQKVDLFDFIIKLKSSCSDKGAFERELVEHFANILKLDLTEVKLRVEFVDEIPLDQSGKLMAVISKVKQIGNS
jgi:phenylacetate-coenzyme A ligase PaaK-like adenylate-forming protein